MKKVFTVVLALIMCLAFVSCSDSNEEVEGTGNNAAVEETTAPEPTEATTRDPQEDWTAEQKNCYKSAQSYIEFTGFSKKGLIDQLSSEYGDGYSKDDAEFVVEYMEDAGEIDWVEQCEMSAKSYLDTGGFSREGLIEQLTSEYGDQYPRDVAEKAVDKVYK